MANKGEKKNDMARPRESERKDVRALVLAAAGKLFMKFGYRDVTMRRIANEIGYSPGTIYLYFKNKDEILYKIIIGVGADLLKELHIVMEQHRDPVESLRSLIIKQIHFSLEGYKKMKLYLEEQYQLRSHHRKKTLEQHRQIYDLYYRKICEIEEKGVLYPADKTVITFGLFAEMNWVYRWFRPDGPISIQEIAENITDLCFRSILKN